MDAEKKQNGEAVHDGIYKISVYGFDQEGQQNRGIRYHQRILRLTLPLEANTLYNQNLSFILSKDEPGSPSLVGRAPGNMLQNHKARSRKGSGVQISLPAPSI